MPWLAKSCVTLAGQPPRRTKLERKTVFFVLKRKARMAYSLHILSQMLYENAMPTCKINKDIHFEGSRTRKWHLCWTCSAMFCWYGMRLDVPIIECTYMNCVFGVSLSLARPPWLCFSSQMQAVTKLPLPESSATVEDAPVGLGRKSQSSHDCITSSFHVSCCHHDLVERVKVKRHGVKAQRILPVLLQQWTCKVRTKKTAAAAPALWLKLNFNPNHVNWTPSQHWKRMP